nr:MAG TPA: hypothetical protein [Caudoviricetes sp.]
MTNLKTYAKIQIQLRGNSIKTYAYILLNCFLTYKIN